MESTVKEAVFRQLMIDEGVRYKIYEDHLGYLTLGIGHLIAPRDLEYGKPIDTPISEDRVQECFNKDLDIAIHDCEALYQNDFNDWPGEVQEVLINMVFNMGLPKLHKFKKMRAALKQKNWREAAAEGRDSLWYQQVTNRAERLMVKLENV